MLTGRRFGEDGRDVLALENDATLVRHLEAGDHPQRRRLPATARPEQREELAFADLERDVAHRLGLAEALADALERDRDASVLRHAGPSVTGKVLPDRRAAHSYHGVWRHRVREPASARAPATPIVASAATPATVKASAVPPTSASQPAKSPPTGAVPTKAKR